MISRYTLKNILHEFAIIKLTARVTNYPNVIPGGDSSHKSRVMKLVWLATISDAEIVENAVLRSQRIL